MSNVVITFPISQNNQKGRVPDINTEGIPDEVAKMRAKKSAGDTEIKTAMFEEAVERIKHFLQARYNITQLECANDSIVPSFECQKDKRGFSRITGFPLQKQLLTDEPGYSFAQTCDLPQDVRNFLKIILYQYQQLFFGFEIGALRQSDDRQITVYIDEGLPPGFNDDELGISDVVQYNQPVRLIVAKTLNEFRQWCRLFANTPKI